MKLSTGCGWRRAHIVELPGEFNALFLLRRSLALVRHVAQQRLDHCPQAAAVDGHLMPATDCETLSTLRLLHCSARPLVCLPAFPSHNRHIKAPHEAVLSRQMQAQTSAWLCTELQYAPQHAARTPAAAAQPAQPGSPPKSHRPARQPGHPLQPPAAPIDLPSRPRERLLGGLIHIIPRLSPLDAVYFTEADEQVQAKHVAAATEAS